MFSFGMTLQVLLVLELMAAVRGQTWERAVVAFHMCAVLVVSHLSSAVYMQ